MERKSIRQSISEMLGRVNPIHTIHSKVLARYNLYGAQPETIDKSQVDYPLMKAVFDATPQAINGKRYGDDMYLGAIFAKPIINSTAAFVVGDVPTIKFDGETKSIEAGEQKINKIMKDYQDIIFDWNRNGYKDGDSYIIFDEDNPRLLPAEVVEKAYDPLTGEILGYDLNFVVEEEDTANKQMKKITYRKEIRKTGEVDYRVEDQKEKQIGSIEYEKEQPFRVISFHNEKDPMALYGKPEVQNCLHLFKNYHAVVQGLVKNVIYNSTPTPVFQGIEEMEEFLATNFQRGTDGTYRIKWDADKLIIGGKGFSATMLSANNVAGDAMQTLNLLFWGICQASETPEFIFGTAVQSSKASVSEQMPIMIKKTNRKRAQFTKSLKDMIDYLIWHYKGEKEISILTGLDYTIEFAPITESDLKLNLEIADKLINLGIITKETAAQLCDIDNIVPDLKKEIELASNEAKKEAEQNSLYAQPLGTNPDNNNDPIATEDIA